MAKIAAVILNYNDKNRVLALAKLLLSYNTFSIIVLSDNSGELEKNSNIMSNSNILILENGENLGYCKGSNAAFSFIDQKYPDIDYLLEINSDVYVAKEVIKGLITFLDKNLSYAIVGARMLEYGLEKASYYNFPTLLSSINDNLYINRLIHKKAKPNSVFTNYIDVDYIRSSLILMRRSYLKEVNYWDNEIFLYYGECALALKLKEKNYHEAILTSFTYNHNHLYHTKNDVNGYKDSCKSLRYIFKKYYNYSKIKIFLYNGSCFVGLILLKAIHLIRFVFSKRYRKKIK